MAPAVLICPLCPSIANNPNSLPDVIDQVTLLSVAANVPTPLPTATFSSIAKLVFPVICGALHCLPAGTPLHAGGAAGAHGQRGREGGQPTPFAAPCGGRTGLPRSTGGSGIAALSSWLWRQRTHCLQRGFSGPSDEPPYRLRSFAEINPPCYVGGTGMGQVSPRDGKG